MKSFGTFPGASLKMALSLLIVISALLTSCSPSGTNPLSLTNDLVPPKAPVSPIPIPDGEDITGDSPEEIAQKKVIEEVSDIQESANLDPELILTDEDIELLKEESLLTSGELKGWVK